MNKKNAFLINVILLAIWLIGIFNYSNYKLAEIELLGIYVVTLICFIKMETVYGELTFLIYTMGLFVCSYPLMDIFGVVDVRQNQFFSVYMFSNLDIIESINIISLTLIAILFAYSLNRNTRIDQSMDKDNRKPLPGYFVTIFIIFCVATLVYRVMTGVLFGAAGSYLLNFGEEIAYAGPSWVRYLSFAPRVTKALIIIALASKPVEKQCNKILLFYLIISATQLLSGQRGPFTVEALFLIWYYCKYYKKIKIRYMVIPAGVIMFVANAVSSIRNNQAVEITSSFFKEFIISQGVSFDVVANTVRYYSELKAANSIGVPYFLGMVHKYLAYLFSSVTFQDSIFGHGQTQAALDGSSYLGWKLTDIISPYQYSIGRGTGSSFVAENYLSLKYLGVFVLTFIMIWFVLYVRKRATENSSIYRSAIYFIVVQALIYTPRNNFWIFISEVVAVFVILIAFNTVFPKLFKINTHINYSMEE